MAYKLQLKGSRSDHIPAQNPKTGASKAEISTGMFASEQHTQILSVMMYGSSHPTSFLTLEELRKSISH
jgi:hypothetical protein